MYGLAQRRAIAEEMAHQRKRRNGVVFLLILGSLLTAAYLEFARRHLHPLGFGSEGGLGNRSSSPDLERGNLRDYHAQFAWIPMLVIFGLAGIAIVAWVLASRRRMQPDLVRAHVRETLEEAIEDALDDLRAESDPRRAVIACYARLERALAAAGFGRRRAETQVEHLARILGELDIGTGSVRRLTDLYQRAKFSQHEVDDGMKEEAIAALVEVRDELRASEERRRELELLVPGAARS